MVQQDIRNEYEYSAVNQDINTTSIEKHAFEEESTIKDYGLGIRHLQVILYFLLGFVAFGFRVSLSVGIVAMTDPSVSSNPDIPTYPEWTDKNVILSAFFWGYILPQIFAGYVAKRYGAKWFLIGTMSLQSILSILMPLTAAKLGAKGVMFSRAIQGVCQGFIFPSCAHFLSQWAPPQERSRFGSVIYTAGKGGTVVAMLLTGLIASSWYGWPAAFYLFGCLGFLWCVSMAIYGYDNPRKDPRITEAERLFIEKSLGYTGEKHHKTPWLKIITSVPVWALFVVQTGNNYCFWTLLTQIPTYMNYVMDFDMKHNSFWSSVPYMSLWILSFFFSSVSDYIINKGIVTRGAARKIFNSIGLMIPAAALIILGYTNANQSIQAVILLTVAVGFNSACFSGFAVNHTDLAPNHAGTLMGLINGFSQIMGVLAPLVVQLLVKNERDPLQWRYVFFIAAGTNITTSVIYNFFGSGEIQRWNREEDEEEKS